MRRPNGWSSLAELHLSRGLNSCEIGGGTLRYPAMKRLALEGPAAPGHPVRSRVLIDRQAPGAAHGFGVDAQVTVGLLNGDSIG
jgi:hypothetical protein